MALYHFKHTSKYKQFEKKLISIYKVYILGDIKNFLGIRVLQNKPKQKLILILNAYIKKITNKFSIPLNIKPPHTPLPPYIDLSPNTGQTTILQLRDYQQKIDSVLYINIQTQPNITKTCSKLSKYNKSSLSKHIKATKHLLRYTINI